MLRAILAVLLCVNPVLAQAPALRTPTPTKPGAGLPKAASTAQPAAKPAAPLYYKVTPLPIDTRAVAAHGDWAPIAAKLKSDPLFAKLGLDTLKPHGTNEFLHTVWLKPAGVPIQYAGLLRIDPDAKDGQPFATLLSVTTGPDSGRMLDIGALRSYSSKLELSVMNQGGTPKLQARVIPSLPNRAPDTAAFSMKSVPSGLEYTLTGSLTLGDLATPAKAVPLVKDLALKSATVSPDKVSVTTQFKGKDAAVTVTKRGKAFTIVAEDISVTDFIPQAAALPVWGSFDAERVAFDDGDMSVSGKLKGKPLTVAVTTTVVTVTGGGLMLADLLPQAAGVPVVSKVALDSLTYHAMFGVSASGKLGAKAVGVTRAVDGSTLTVTGKLLTLADFIPAAAKVPGLDRLVFEKLAVTPETLAVYGRVNTDEVMVRSDAAAKSFSVVGEDVRISDFFPEAKGMPVLDGFAFEELTQTPEGVVARGTIDGKAASVKRSADGKSLVVSAADLTLADLIPQAKDIPLLSRFAFSGYSQSAASVTVTGSVDAKPVVVSRAKDEVTVTGAALTLADFVPQAGELPVLSRFALDKAVRSPKALFVSGKLGAVPATVSYDQASGSFTLTSAGLKLADLVPEAASLPVLSRFTVTSVLRGGTRTSAAGTIGGKSATVSSEAKDGSYIITGQGLTVGDFLPQAAKVPLLSKFAFLSLERTPGQVQVDGTFNGKAVSVTQKDAEAALTVTGAGLTLADFTPSAAGLPVLKQFAFDSATFTDSYLLVKGEYVEKAVSVRSTLDGKVYTITGDSLVLGDFIPEAHALPLLDKLAFASFSRFASSMSVSGTLNGKALSVSKPDGKPEVTVTGADLLLADLIPAAADIPVASRLAFEKAVVTAEVLTVAGKVGPAAATVSYVKDTGAVTVASSGLKLSDLIPAASAVPGLDKFAVTSVSYLPGKASAAGTVGGKAATVAYDQPSDTLVVTGDSLTLATLIPEAAVVPGLSRFAFKSLTRAPAGTTVDGSVGGKAVSVRSEKERLTVTGTLAAADVFPEAAGMPVLSRFVFADLVKDPQGLVMHGAIGAKLVSVKRSQDGKTLDVEGAALTLSDLIPEAAAIPFLNKFSVSAYSRSDSSVTVKGAVGERPVTVAKDAKGDITVDGQLTAADFVPQAAGWPVVSRFTFDRSVVSGKTLTVLGQVGAASASIVVNADGSVTFASAGLKLSDLIPEASGLDAFAVKSVTKAGDLLTVTGTVNGKAASCSDTADGFTITGAGLQAADFIPEAASVPELSKLAFSSYAYRKGAYAVTGTWNGKAVSVSRAQDKTVIVTGGDLTLDDFVPAAAGLPLVKSLAFEELDLTAALLTVTGRVAGQPVTVKVDRTTKLYTVTGTLDLAQLLPSAADIAFLKRLVLQQAVQSTSGVTVTGTIDGKAVSIRQDGGKVLTVTGDQLKVADLIPQAAGLPIFDKLAFTSAQVSATLVTVSGTLNGKAVTVTRDAAKNEVDVAGAQLQLSDLVPQAASLPLLKTFAFTSLSVTDAAFAISGTVSGKAVDVHVHPDTGYYCVAGAGLTASDFFPEAATMSSLNDFAFASAASDADGLTLTGTIDGKAVTVTRSADGKTLVVSGANLKLSDFIPQAAAIGYLDRFAFTGFSRSPSGVTVTGTVDGKAVSVAKDNASGAVTVNGKDLVLADLVPQAKDLAFLDKFSVSQVTYAAGVLTVAGKAGTAAVSVAYDQAKRSLVVTSPSLKLSDIVPAASVVPGLSQFALKSVEKTADKLTVAGTLAGRQAAVTAAKDAFTVTGAQLRLSDFVPGAANLPVLSQFGFESLTQSPAQGTVVSGRVNGEPVAVKSDPASKTTTVTGQDLRAQDFIPAAGQVPVLNRVVFDSAVSAPSGLSVSGRIDGKAVSFKQDSGAKSFSVTGDGLRLSDFIPQAAGVPLLDKVAFTGFSRSGTATTVAGTVDGKAVSISKDDAADAITVTGAGLGLADLVPNAGDVPVLSRFAFDSALVTPQAVAVSGRVDKANVKVSLDRQTKAFSVTSDGLKLSDFVPQAAAVPVLGGFALKMAARDDQKTSVAGTLAGRSASVTVQSADQFTVTGDNLSLSSFVPEASRVPLLNAFALSSLTRTPAAFTVAGSVNGKAVSVSQSFADKVVSVKGDGLRLADFVPAAAGVAFLNEFAFDGVTASSAAVVVTGRISGKAVSVRKGLGEDKSFLATGDGLRLSDIVPEATLKAFDRLTLSLVSVSPAEIKVEGGVSGKAVRFSKTRATPSVVTITADDLKLGDIFDPLASIPVINAVAMDKLSLDGASVEVEAKLNGDLVDVVSHVRGDAYTAVFFKTLDAATFIPAASGHAVNDIALRNALFIVQPENAPAKSVTAADLPGGLPGLVGWGSDSLKIGPGLSFAATLDVSGSGALSSALKTVGLGDGAIPLRGTLPPQAFKAMGGSGKGSAASLPPADKQALLSGLSLSGSVSLPKLPSLAGLVAVTGPVRFSIDGGTPDGPWAKLPAALSAQKPAGDLDLSLEFGVDILGADVGRRLDAVVSLARGAQPGMSLLAVQEGTWDKPFGIDGLTLSGGGFRFALDSGKEGGLKDLAFFASAAIGGKKDVAVSADFAKADGKLALNYFELDGSFTLQDLPGGKSIPYGDKFELDMLKIAKDGIEAKTVIGGKKVDAFLFEAGPGNWTFAIDQDDFKITELLPAAKAIKPLADLTIPKAALIITQKGLSGPRSSFGTIAKDMLDEIFGKSNVSVKLPGGIALLADFDPGAMGDLGKGLSKIGVHGDAIIMGELTGVFDGTPGMRLSFAMAQAGDPSGLPKKAMAYKDGVSPEFFVLWGAEDLEAGLKIPVLVHAGKDTLELSTSIELEFSPEGVGIKVVGAMDGTWHEPFGIPGIALSNLKMDAAIDADTNVQLGFAGEERFGSCANPKSSDCIDLDLAASVKFPAEDGIPDAIAFAGKANQLGVPAVLDIAEEMMKLPGQLSKLPVPFFLVKDAKLAFATPGASDPDLGLVAQGFAFAGTFNFMNQDLGAITGAGGPTSGVSFKGKIADIDLDILKFSNNDVDIKVDINPKFIINSDVKLLGAVQRVKLDIEPPHFEFLVVEKLGVFGEAELTVRLDGFDLAKGTFDKTADISVVGIFKETLEPWLEAEITKGVDELRESAKAKLEADKQALRDAQKKVDEIDDKIQAIKAEDDRAKARAEDTLNSVENRVNGLQGDYDNEIDRAHHCGHWYSHWACAPAHYVAAAAIWVSLEAAKGVLEAAKAAVAAAFDLDPRLAALYAEKDIATAALTVATAVLDAAEAVEDWVLKELENLLIAAIKDFPFEVKEAILIGDLKGMIDKNEPLILDMKFSMAGVEMREYFAVKIPDNEANAEFDAVAFALLPAIALDKMTEAALSKVSGKIATWVHAHIGDKLASAQEAVYQQVAAEEAKFKDVLATMEDQGAKFQQAYMDQGAAQADLAAATKLTDLLGDSQEYKMTYLAIGHSNLCLDVAKDGMSVVQDKCKDGDAQRWSTTKIDDGYVQLKAMGLCLRARNGDAADNNEPLILGQCDKDDDHEKWKVVSTDGFWDKLANRYSQKCLHFNTEDANPNTAFAVWTGCMGADSQNFRDIPDAELTTWHPVNREIKARNGLCLGAVETFSMRTGMEEKMYARPCDGKSERFGYNEEVDGDIKIVHADTGACLYPKLLTNELALRPCDAGEDMFWRVDEAGGTADRLFNKAMKLCMMLPAPPPNTSTTLPAKLANCVDDDDKLLDFVK